MVSVARGGTQFRHGTAMLKVGTQYDSIILEADAKHLMTDVWTSVAWWRAWGGDVCATLVADTRSLMAVAVGLTSSSPGSICCSAPGAG